MPYLGLIANTLQASTIIPAPPRAPQSELINYSKTPQFSTQTNSFANTDKTSSSELPQPIHTVLNINDTPQDISLSQTPLDPLSSQFSSPTPSQFASNPFNPPQVAVSNMEGLLSHKPTGITLLIYSIYHPHFKVHYHSVFSVLHL